jgi:hypothetical protein
VVLGTNGTTTLAAFLYHDIQWGVRAQIGVNAGDGYSSFTLSEALAAPIENVDNSTNVGLPGVFIFRIDSKNDSKRETILMLCIPLILV